jgi:Helix-turn-helix domain
MAAGTGRSKMPKGQKRESFIQPLTGVIRNHGQLSPAELAVYLHLHTYDWDGEGTWVGQKTIAKELGISERTVRDGVNKLERVGAIECQRRPGQSNLYKVKKAWLPGDSGNSRRGKSSKTSAPTPAESAGDPGNVRRAPRRNLPPAPAESAAETDAKNYTQKAEARTDRVPPPAASEVPLSGTTSGLSQEPNQEGPAAAPLVKKSAVLPPISLANNSSASDGFGMEALPKGLANMDYCSPRQDAAEEAQVVELATRFNQIQTVMGKEKATGLRWQKFLTGFRMMLFSAKHGRSYEDACLVLDYLKRNPTRAKEIVNKDNKRGVTNTYHLMFLFDRLHNEAVGLQSEAEKMFSKRKVRITDPAQSSC